MDTDLLHSASFVARGRMLRLPPSPGQRVECLRGMLWLTIDRDPRDILLGPGEGFTFDRDAPSLVSAFEDSALVVLDGVQP
jgi:hypothetical protein